MKIRAVFFCWLLCTAVGGPAASLAVAAAQISAADLGLTRFADLLDRVIADDAVSRRAFAETAVAVMIDAYLNEVEAFERDQERTEVDPSWRAGTLQYVEQLKAFALMIDHVADVDIVREPHGSVRLIAGNRQVMFHAPRESEQTELERAVVDAVCLQRHCESNNQTVEDRVIAQMNGRTGAWQFDQDAEPTYTTADGLQCVFRDQRHLRLKKEACKKIIYELRFVAEAFKALDAKGARLDWSAIRLGSTGSANPNKLVYNRRGQYFHARLPTLWRSQRVLHDSMSWLQARVDNRVEQFVIRPPDDAVYTAATPR